MAVSPERFTLKTQEAIQNAQQIAREKGHQELTPEHLLLALVCQSDSVVRPLLQKAKVQPSLLEGRLEEALGKLPKVSGAQIYASQRLAALLDKAWDEAQALKDEYLSAEHLLIACGCEETLPQADQGRLQLALSLKANVLVFEGQTVEVVIAQ